VIQIRFEINGRQADSHLRGAFEKAIFENICERLRSKLSNVRDPNTGESPALVVVRGQDLEHLSFEISGSERVVALAKVRLGISEDIPASPPNGDGSGKTPKPPPCAFVCHASENKPLARKIAEDLMKHGIDTFFDEGEIRL
jgi:hypothetical protein